MEGTHGPGARVLGRPWRAGGGEEAKGSRGGHGRAGFSAVGNSPWVGREQEIMLKVSLYLLSFFFLENSINYFNYTVQPRHI